MPIEKTRGSTLGWPASPLTAPYAFLPPRPLTSELQLVVGLLLPVELDTRAAAVTLTLTAHLPRFRLVLGVLLGKIRFMEPTTTPLQTETREAMSSPPLDRVRIVSTPGTCGGRPHRRPPHYRRGRSHLARADGLEP